MFVKGVHRMAGEKPRKNNKKDMVDRVIELVRLGRNDSQIGRALGIHRTTVKRYREQGEKRAIGTEARTRVIQEALSKHFDDLVQVCERLQNGTISDKPQRVVIEDLQTRQELTTTLSGRRGDEVKAVLRLGEGKVELDRLTIEDDLIFASFKQHTKNLDFWPLVKEWKDKSGEYIADLSEFYHLLKQRAVKETGLKVGDSPEGSGLTLHFAKTIYSDICDHAFFGYKGFEQVDYAIHSPRPDCPELRFDGYTIASVIDKAALERCQEVHQRMMVYFRDPHNYPQELKRGMKDWSRLKELESQSNLALQKLILKRTFAGRCELCPD